MEKSLSGFGSAFLTLGSGNNVVKILRTILYIVAFIALTATRFVRRLILSKKAMATLLPLLRRQVKMPKLFFHDTHQQWLYR